MVSEDREEAVTIGRRSVVDVASDGWKVPEALLEDALLIN